MKKILAILITVVGAILFVVGINYFAKTIDETVNKEKIIYEPFIGKSYILNKDTLMIVDFSLFNETFILSNGVEVNKKLILETYE